MSVVREALRSWAEQQGLDPRRVFFFMCFFVNNQYRVLVECSTNPSDHLEEIFEANLNRIGKVVAVLDSWESPMYLKRIWTIFEQHIAIQLGIEVTIVMTPEAVLSLLQEFALGADGIFRVKHHLSIVDAETAEASFKKDEDKVKLLIRSSVGFTAVNEKIVGAMIRWVGQELQTYMKALVEMPALTGERSCARGCGFQATWHPSVCCSVCSNEFGSHGPRCERKLVLASNTTTAI